MGQSGEFSGGNPWRLITMVPAKEERVPGLLQGLQEQLEHCGFMVVASDVALKMPGEGEPGDVIEIGEARLQIVGPSSREEWLSAHPSNTLAALEGPDAYRHFYRVSTD